MTRLPPWIKKRAPRTQIVEQMTSLLRSFSLHTVCEEAHCPNIGECFSWKTATFMILGNRCTRNCRFCAVEHKTPWSPDPEEPENVARAVKMLGLKYVVITSVTRDDLKDGGASQFAQTIEKIRKINGQNIKIEILIPDFQGSLPSLETVIQAKPTVLNHNLETAPRLYPEVRPGANYLRSIKLLQRVKEIAPYLYTKSGLMDGLGETFSEVIEVMEDMRRADCNILTLGQYLRPSSSHLSVKEFVIPERFTEYKKIGSELGFSFVASGPFVRSSYGASEALPT